MGTRRKEGDATDAAVAAVVHEEVTCSVYGEADRVAEVYACAPAVGVALCAVVRECADGIGWGDHADAATSVL